MNTRMPIEGKGDVCVIPLLAETMIFYQERGKGRIFVNLTRSRYHNVILQFSLAETQGAARTDHNECPRHNAVHGARRLF